MAEFAQRIVGYSYLLADDIDEECNHCQMMTICMKGKNGEETYLSDITIGENPDEEFLAEVCEEIIENHGFVLENNQ